MSSFLASFIYYFFFFTAPATTEINPYLHTLSLHDAFPVYLRYHAGDGDRPVRRQPDAVAGQLATGADAVAGLRLGVRRADAAEPAVRVVADVPADRKSTRLNSSH